MKILGLRACIPSYKMFKLLPYQLNSITDPDKNFPIYRWLWWNWSYKRSTLNKLQQGETIDLKGIRLKMDNGLIKIGDLYIAERNTGPKLLIAKKIDEETGYIIPTTIDYLYGMQECVKVKEV